MAFDALGLYSTLCSDVSGEVVQVRTYLIRIVRLEGIESFKFQKCVLRCLMLPGSTVLTVRCGVCVGTYVAV